jgi:hypothetical protein
VGDDLDRAVLAHRLECTFQSGIAVGFAFRIAYIGDAVAEHQQRVAPGKNRLANELFHFGIDAEGNAHRRQSHASVPGAEQIRRVVAGIAKAQRGGRQIEYAVKHRYEHARLIFGGQKTDWSRSFAKPCRYDPQPRAGTVRDTAMNRPAGMPSPRDISNRNAKASLA